MMPSSVALPRTGFLRESADTQAVSPVWQRLFLLLHCALFLPYISAAIPALYRLELFPLRPALFMLGLCLLNLCLLFPKGPDFTKTALALIALLAFRCFDIAILERFLYPDGQSEPMFSSIALVLMAALMAASHGVIRKTSPLPILLVSGGAVLLGTVSVLLEFAGLIEMSTVPGRAAGFAGDSNDACMIMTLMLAVFLTLSRAFWLNLGFICITAIGVLPTLSRGGMLSLMLIALTFAILNLRQHATKLLLAVAVFVPVAGLMVGLLINSTNTGGVVDQNAKKRIEAIFGGDVENMHSDERMKDLTDGWEAAQAHPLVGLGTGAGTMLYQPHNQFVSLWIELGILGPVSFVAILGIAAIKVLRCGGRGLYILVPLVLYIPLAQSLLDNYAYLYAAFVLLYATSTHFYTFRLARLPAAGVSP